MVQDRFNAMCIFNCQQLLIMLKKKTQIGNTMFKTYLSLPACIIHLTNSNSMCNLSLVTNPSPSFWFMIILYILFTVISPFPRASRAL